MYLSGLYCIFRPSTEPCPLLRPFATSLLHRRNFTTYERESHSPRKKGRSLASAVFDGQESSSRSIRGAKQRRGRKEKREKWAPVGYRSARGCEGGSRSSIKSGILYYIPVPTYTQEDKCVKLTISILSKFLCIVNSYRF